MPTEMSIPEADGLCEFLNASPSPFHACATAAALLGAAGFTALAEGDSWPTAPGRYVVVRGGSLVAWSTEHATGPAVGFRIVGAHTDSPNLRVKPQPDLVKAGWQMVGVEPYGGLLLNSWLDRDLGLSGRLAVRGDAPGDASGDASGDARGDARGNASGEHARVRTRLVVVDEPILRVPQLAIHLDRSVHEEGVRLDRQQHMPPLWGLGGTPGDIVAYVAEHADVDPADVLGFDLMTHDLTPARRVGRDRDLVASARLDNLATAYAAVRALLGAVDDAGDRIPLIVLFDHEEVGSMSERGALSTLLPDVLARVVSALGGDETALRRAVARSVCASGDMAHATHPNYAERHEPQHHIQMNGGPVLKINANLRYATDAVGAAHFRLACEQVDVPFQQFVNRSDLPCGSTVGPFTAGSTGMTTVDFGAPTLAMHSTREVCGATDMDYYVAALTAFLAPAAAA